MKFVLKCLSLGETDKLADLFLTRAPELICPIKEARAAGMAVLFPEQKPMPWPTQRAREKMSDHHVVSVKTQRRTLELGSYRAAASPHIKS